MSLSIHPYIEKIVDVRDEGNCEFGVVVEHLGKGENTRSIICYTLLKE